MLLARAISVPEQNGSVGWQVAGTALVGATAISLLLMYFCATASILVGSMMPCAANAALGWKNGLACRKATTFASGVPPGPACEKFPASISGLNVLIVRLRAAVRFWPWELANQNSLSFLTGPPTAKPYWFRFSVLRGIPFLLLK